MCQYALHQRYAGVSSTNLLPIDESVDPTSRVIEHDPLTLGVLSKTAMMAGVAMQVGRLSEAGKIRLELPPFHTKNTRGRNLRCAGIQH